MASIFNPALLANFSGEPSDDFRHPGERALANLDKAMLVATALSGFVVARTVFALTGLPAVPGVSSLLLQQQPFYAAIVAAAVLVGLTVIARPIVGRIRSDAPLFCAATALLALPMQSGDVRNALLDAGQAGVYLKMAAEIGLLATAIAVGYLALAALQGTTRLPGETLDDAATPSGLPDIDTAADRAAAVAVQALLVLALLSVLGQSPLKGQALLSVALAGGLGAWISHKTRLVRGSVWYVGGTLLAGAVAYVWTSFHAEGLALGDTRGYLAGAARSLPLHYATAGVAGTIYGYWAACVAPTGERDESSSPRS